MSVPRLSAKSAKARVGVLCVLLALVAPAGVASATAPVFSGEIPTLWLEAGTDVPGAYDLSSHFSDPDRDPLTYRVLENTAPAEWGISLTFNGSLVDLHSSNVSAWGHGALIVIAASDRSLHAESNRFQILLAPPPITERTWVLRDDPSNSGGEVGPDTCGAFAALRLMGYPTDGIAVELTEEVYRMPPPPPEGTGNSSTTPPSREEVLAGYNNTTARLVVTLNGSEVLNETLTETPTRVYYNISAINEFVANSAPEARMVGFWLNYTLCIDGPGPLWVRHGFTHEEILRLPPGDDGADLNLTAPKLTAIALSSASPDRLPAGEPITYTLQSAGALGADFEVEWLLDGAPVGRGPALTDFRMPEGKHLLEARASNGIVHRAVSLRLTAVGPDDTKPSSPPTVQVAPDTGIAVVGLVVFVSVAAAAFVSGTELGRYALLGGLLGALASRGKRPSPLDHFVRGQLFQIIKENPGIHFTEILRRGELANGSASHHLRVLEKAGLVRVVLDGTKTRFYLTDERPDRADYGLTNSDRRVLDAVFENPGIEQFALAGRLGLSKTRVNRSVSRLTFLGFVLKSRRGKSTVLYLRGDGPPDAALLRPFSEGTE